jgi:hypothetical protein
MASDYEALYKSLMRSRNTGGTPVLAAVGT